MRGGRGYARQQGVLYSPVLSGSSSLYIPGNLHGLQDGGDWGNVKLNNGVLCGTTVSPAPPYNDSVTLIRGTSSPNIQLVSTVYRGANSTAANSQECEHLLNGTITSGVASFYESMMAVHGTNIYVDLVRWNGPLNSFTILRHITAGLSAAQNGWLFKTTKIGPMIRIYIDDGGGFDEITTFDVSTADANPNGATVYTGGLAGIGFYQRGGAAGNLLEFGWSALTITAL